MATGEANDIYVAWLPGRDLAGIPPIQVARVASFWLKFLFFRLRTVAPTTVLCQETVAPTTVLFFGAPGSLTGTVACTTVLFELQRQLVLI